MDVILKLPGGSIDAHRSILAAVSPVFEKLFYGDAKEGKSMTIDLPKDNYNTMNMLIDFVYRGSCELKNRHDTFPILEAFDQYQINKVPFYYMCSEVILEKLDSSNYLTLLPKFASVMSEEGTRKAANIESCSIQIMTSLQNLMTQKIYQKKRCFSCCKWISLIMK